jgi:hypothetical protein
MAANCVGQCIVFCNARMCVKHGPRRYDDRAPPNIDAQRVRVHLETVDTPSAYQSVHRCEVTMTLSDVLAPMAFVDFLREYAGQRYAIIKGIPGRFRHLVRWSELNEALTHLRVEGERAFLIKNGTPLDPSSYQVAAGSGGGRLLNGSAVTRHIAAGATLVINKVDELLPDVRALAESCEEAFHIYVSTNLYAGWKTDKAFDVHWDRHDTVILQVRGSKDWTIWAPTRLHPLHDDPMEDSPSSEPVWQGTLTDGDVLYMPRGWWHVARPRDELSLHLTVGLRHRTGVDLLGWVVDQIKSNVDARMDVPHWKDEDERRDWRRAIRDAVDAALAEDVIERYMDNVRSSAQGRPILSLQDTISARPAIDDDTPLRLTQGPTLQFSARVDEATASFVVRGTEWQCHAAMRPALKMLNHITPTTLREMGRLVTPAVRPFLRPFVVALVVADVIWAEPRVRDDDEVMIRRLGERTLI